MDEIVELFESSVGASTSGNEDRTNFDGLYKNWGRLGSQEERRKELLSVQKNNRKDNLDSHRGILDLVRAVEENETIYQKRVFYRPSIYVAGFHRASPSYKNVLMLSEWMIEKPSDFSENWLIVPCPKGNRMLVVANQGKTKFYSKYGQFKFEKRTALPGGNPCDPKHKYKCIVLDGFYQENINTLFVLDLLVWNHPMTDGETEFRHYWLKTQFMELSDLMTINKKNQVNIKLLPKTPCSPEELNKFMTTYPMFEDNVPILDGLLMYHKQAHYVSGETPLVGWLFPYMVPEVLGSEITVHEEYINLKPTDYVDQAVFVQKFEAKYAKKRNRNTSTNQMDTTDQTEENSSNVSGNGEGNVAEVMDADAEADDRDSTTDNQAMGDNSVANPSTENEAKAPQEMEAEGSREEPVNNSEVKT